MSKENTTILLIEFTKALENKGFFRTDKCGADFMVEITSFINQGCEDHKAIAEKTNGLDWIKTNRDVLSKRGINARLKKSIGMPLGTLTKAVDGTQDLPKKWIEPLNRFVDELKTKQ